MGNALIEEIVRRAREKKKRREEAMASMTAGYEMPKPPKELRRLYSEQARLLRMQRQFGEEQWRRYKKFFQPEIYAAARAARAGRIAEYDIALARSDLAKSYQKAKQQIAYSLSRYGLDINLPQFEETWNRLALFRRAAEAGLEQGIRESVRTGNLQRLAGLLETGPEAATVASQSLARAQGAYAAAADIMGSAYNRALQLTLANIQAAISQMDLAEELDYRRQMMKLKTKGEMWGAVGQLFGQGVGMATAFMML